MLKKALGWTVALFGIALGMLGSLAANNRVSGHNEAATILAIAMLLACFAMILGSICAAWDRYRWGKLLLVAGFVLTVAFMPLELGFGGSALLLATLIFPGAFWLITARRNWSELLAGQTMPRMALVAACASVLLVLLGGFCAVLLPVRYVGDCGEKPPFSVPQNERHAVFTAQVVFIGFPRYEYASLRVTPWVIAHVDQKYWGAPSWFGYAVIRAPFPTNSKSGRYFVDSFRDEGLITRFLPSVELNQCSGTRELVLAEAFLRSVREGPKPGVRIIGLVVDRDDSPAAGIKVAIEGPSGRLVVNTDAQGVYDAVGLPLGRYSVAVLPTTERPPFHQSTYTLESGAVWGQTLRVH